MPSNPVSSRSNVSRTPSPVIAARRNASWRRRARLRSTGDRSARSSDGTNTRQWRPRWRGLPDIVKPRALAAGDRVAIIAPASPFARDEFEAGLTELRQLGFDPVYSEDVFARTEYLAGLPALRARDFVAAWSDPAVRAVIAAR